MKRFFSFLAISTIALTMASCGGDSNAPALKNFKVQVKDLTETSLTLEIEALIPDKYFCFDFVTEEAFKKNGADFYFKKAIEQIEVYHMLPEELFSKNKVSVPYQIEQGTDYVLCLFYVNDDLELDGEIEHTVISTKPQEVQYKENVIQSTANFDVSVTNITATTATLKIEPKESVQFYSYDIISKYAYTKHKEVALAKFGGDGNTEPLMIDLADLMPDAEYIIYMRKEDEKGEPLGDMETVTFRTANIETVELPKKELTGYVANVPGGSIRIYAEDTNENIYSLAVISTQLTGSFSTEDLVYRVGALVRKGEEDYPIFRTNFTGRKDGETTYVYEGWFDCADGFRYNFRFTCAYFVLED